MHWFDKAQQQAEYDLENGDISQEEYNDIIRDIQEAHEQEAHDAAEQAYKEAKRYINNITPQ